MRLTSSIERMQNFETDFLCGQIGEREREREIEREREREREIERERVVKTCT